MTDDNDDADWASFKCLDCSVNTSALGEYYMVQFEVWAEAFGEYYEASWQKPENNDKYFAFRDKTSGMLCIGCLEIRLGRQLTSDDFTGALINLPSFGSKSTRILERMGVQV